MQAKIKEKEKAIQLRKKGYSYKDIIKKVPVAKSSISLWLKDLPLTKKEMEYLKTRTNANISRGRIKAASELRQRRIERENVSLNEAKIEFEEFVKDPLFHTGISLYWAEGLKRGNFFGFSNSDPEMLKIMILWVEKFLNISRLEVKPRICAHKAYVDEDIELFWADILSIPIKNFRKTTIKPSKFNFKKRPSYMGCVRLELSCSINYLRKIIFWKNMLIEYYSSK